jgi:class 3 adenylate cyclase
MDAGYPVEAIRVEQERAVPWKPFIPDRTVHAPGPTLPRLESTFLPRIAGQTFLEGRELPLKLEMVSLFVDMVDSTRLVLRSSAEEVLEIMQAFMEIVIDIGAYHCGDVHDFEGDGALLYFQGPGEAVPAAFALRDALLRRRASLPALPLPRVSLDAGPVVIGVVGTRFRRTVSLVGPSVHVAARILKLAPPGAIVATDTVLEHARGQNPGLAREFRPLAGAPSDPDLRTVRTWVAPAPEELLALGGSREA